ncbi:hypothetical protein trd_0727 [Thermomicrobium roseum DSM 5159]|uniref:Uncharacterized protein n=1 Tax=Thermomicrobium roseum (strain ATCC 27502 / DSM 5159 / P-2) TaxID=309801 RepID=B9KZ16_THERP|nr:hypothetical protein trd_0727 [Thermomicrobium roseum DSM 5159]
MRSSDSFGTARADLLFEWSVARRVESNTGRMRRCSGVATDRSIARTG